MPKKVCIIGAGPSGLVAAKSLLHDVPKGTFDVTIFDAQTRIGGLWPSGKDDNDGMMHPQMVANQSKHTVQFSDLAWEEDDPEFPKAWQVGRYLQRYLERYCQDSTLRLGTRVDTVEILPNSIKDGQGPRWKVMVYHEGKREEHEFDYLLVASGYFGAMPMFPEGPEDAEAAEVPVIHSSRYRDLASLLASKPHRKGGKILVVGGQMSGVEIAGTIATHLSSAVHSPGTSPIPYPETYSVHHLTQKPVWVFPLYTSPKPNSSAPPFIPLDLPSYNLSNRPKPLVNTQGHISKETAKAVHSVFENLLGTDQSIFSPKVAISNDDQQEPPWLAMSDYYMEFVRSGLISVSRGRFEYLSGHDARISTPERDEIKEVAAVVLAVGFDPLPSLSYLPPPVLATLAVSNDVVNPILLAFHGTHHAAIPTLGFVGYYRSPYWGVMEMQARFITALWHAGGPSSPNLPPSMATALKKDSSIFRTVSLRSDPRISQFPMGDYLWLMSEFATALGLERSTPLGKMPQLPPAGDDMDILTPARYPSKNLSEEQQSEVIKSLRQTETTVWAGLASGKFMAKAVFRSLAGKWKLERDLISKLPSHPSGHFSGTVQFLLREATKEGREAEYNALKAAGEHQGYEYLYIEEGEFKAQNGLCFQASRRYVWRYDEKTDKLSVWFAKVDFPKMADYLFHDIQFMPGPDLEKSVEGSGTGLMGWCARADHLCEQDFYDVDYSFDFKAVNLDFWRLSYTVKGPKKDYKIGGIYSR